MRIIITFWKTLLSITFELIYVRIINSNKPKRKYSHLKDSVKNTITK